ncbi:MAG: hypothetical protein Kow0020_11050 [Wenzhouxiangellaceae bacterium]
MIKRTLQILVLSALLIGSTVSAQSILLMNEECGGSAQYGPVALSNLGLVFTEVNDWTAFETTFGDGSAWDLVVIDSYGNNITAAGETALVNYIGNGGSVLVAYWDLANVPSVATALETSVVSIYGAPETINVWSPGAPLFNSPNPVSGPLAPIADTCVDDGQRLEPVGSGMALAGYTAAPTANEAAIVEGNGGRTIVFGFIPGLYDTDIVPLYENAIQNLIGGGVPQSVPVPAMSVYGMLALGLVVLFIGGIAVRRTSV